MHNREEMLNSIARINQIATLAYVDFTASRHDIIDALWKIMQETGKYIEEYIEVIPEG